MEDYMKPGADIPVEMGWIGVDLDGTLAAYDGWRGIEHIGAPVPAMATRVIRWVTQGKTVKIFTARACTPDAIPFIKQWLEDNGFPPFEITNVKDYFMDELWDDRCVNVIPNTGQNSHQSPRGLCEWQDVIGG